MAGRRRKYRKRLEQPEPLEDVLERAGENRFARKQLPIPLPQWRAAVGPRIADKARPLALERGVLVVKVVTSVWANELSMLTPELVVKLAERGFAVKSFKFRVGPLDVIEGLTQRREYRRVPPPAALDATLTKSLAAVEDDELRASIERAARANLAWQGASAAPRDVRGPRDAGTGSAPPDRSAEGSGAASRRSSGGDSGRRR
jgi:hypothetical protein